MLNVLVSVAQWERETTAERTKDALAHLRDQGVRLGGAALGWKYTGRKDTNGRKIARAVADEASAVVRIVKLRKDGLTLWAIAEKLTEEGQRTKRGGRWAADRILGHAG